MVTSTSKISPAGLIAELRDLRSVDWSSVWSGPPGPGTPEFQRWLDRYGWKNETVENNLEVVTRHGNELDFESNGFWHPVNSITMRSLLRVRTSSPEEKEDVISRGVSSWEEYVQTVSEVFGAPTWAGAGYADDFPDPPYVDLWSKASSSQDNPYRMAYWASSDTESGKPIIVLTQNVALMTWESNQGASSNVSLEFDPPKPRRRRG